MKPGDTITEILIGFFILSVLLGFVFPYSIFALTSPLVFIFWLVSIGSNVMVLWWWFAIPKETKELRASWKPCHKALNIEREVFAFQQPKSIKFFIVPILAILCVFGVIFLLLIPQEGIKAGLAGGGILALAGGTLLAVVRTSGNEIIATCDSLVFNMNGKKAVVPWGELLSIVKITSYGIESFRLYTTKKVLTYNAKYKDYDRLTSLIHTALNTESDS